MVFAIISGIILTRSIFTIRRYFIEHEAEDFIDTPMLLQHSAAFGLFLIANVIVGTGAILNEIDPTDFLRTY